jgi:quinol monooxygenase YgiN
MSVPIVYIDTSEIRQGRLPEVKVAVNQLAEFVEAHEPQLISYEFYFSENETRMTLVAVHPDSASMEFHMEVAGPAFRKFADLVDLLRIDVYGPLTDKSLKQLQQKAQLLGNGTVTVHEKHAGFIRFRAR